MARGRPQKINDEAASCLKDIVKTNPTATHAEIRSELKRRMGIDAHEQTIINTLRKYGIKRVRSKGAVKIKKAEPGPQRYGYTEAHRRQEPEQTYPSCLTDNEWELVHDIFEIEGGRGTPPTVSRRVLVDACCYIVRTGASWRMLPAHFPPWQNVY